MVTTSSRKRKKSKYMCYPYTELMKLNAQIFTPKRVDYLEEESEKITKSALVGERMKIAAAKLLGTSPIMKKKDDDTSATLLVYMEGSSKSSSFEISSGVEEEQLSL